MNALLAPNFETVHFLLFFGHLGTLASLILAVAFVYVLMACILYTDYIIFFFFAFVILFPLEFLPRPMRNILGLFRNLRNP